MKKYAGEEFLNKIYKNLVNSEIVKHTGKGGNKNEDVHTYMERLERVTSNSIKHNKLPLLKKFYYDKYIIKKENVPESYFKHQEQIALDRGYGHVHYTEETKEQELNQIISEQKASLDLWIDYFSSKDTEMYPTWFKYYCFQGMIKLGFFDKKEEKYTKRTEGTVKPFIEINREALAMVYDELIKVLNKEQVDDKKLEELLKGGSFSKIYAYCIKKIDSVKKDNIKSDDGIWKKYLQESDPNILFNDIHGKGTGWCTAGGLETATQHINGGDFYVYFTKDENGEYTCPRIAIRTQHKRIAEIRGIAEEQNLESNMEKVVEKKLEEFPDKDEYKKKCKDMEMLTYIYTKWNNNNDIELSKNELTFLYEVETEILGFGFKRDPRAEEIIKTRDIRKDLAFIFDCKEEQISLTPQEALKDNIVCHYGNLEYNDLINAENIVIPRIVNGSVKFKNLKTIDNMKFPEILNGLIDLSNVTNIKNLKLPKKVSGINGNIILNKLEKAEGLELPKSMGGYLDMSSLKDAKDIVFPETIEGYLDLKDLSEVKGVVFPKQIKGILYLSSLTSAEGLVLPEKIETGLDLNNLKSAKGLVLTESICGDIELNSLTSAEGLVLPKTMNANLNLENLIDAKGLVFPETMNGNIKLRRLTNAEGMILPKTMNGDLSLDGLTSAEGLVLPEIMNGDLSFDRLTSAKGLLLHKIMNGDISFYDLTSVEDLVLPEKMNGSLYFGSLKRVNGLVFPETMDGYINLEGLTNAEDMILPKTMNGNIYLEELQTAKNIVFPKTMNGNIYLDELERTQNIVFPETMNGYIRLEELTSTAGLIIPDELDCVLDCPLVDDDLEDLKEMCKGNNKTK